MKQVPNANDIRCFVPKYNENGLDELLIANDKFRFIDADDVDNQKEALDTNGMTVYNFELMEETDVAYAIMGNNGWDKNAEGIFE